jgi:hypothetical protein
MLPIREAAHLRRSSPHRPLLRALLAKVAQAGLIGTVLSSSNAPWASATFQGTRHLVTLQLHGADTAAGSDGFADTLPETLFAIPGHIVADITVDEREDRPLCVIFQLSALTIEDW